MDSIRDWWDTLEPNKKKMYIIGGVAAVVLGLIMMAGGNDNGPRRSEEDRATTQTILADDQGAADIQELNASRRVMEEKVQRTEDQMQQLSKDLQRLRGTIAAANNVQDNPEQVAALIDEVQRLRSELERVEEATLNGRVGGMVMPSELPGSSNGASVGEAGAIDDPFSGTPSGSVSEYLDPLARIKGNLAGNGRTETGNAQNQRRFGQLKDQNLGEVPKIVISDQKKGRKRADVYINRAAGGSNRGAVQSTRDLRGGTFVEDEDAIFMPSGTLLKGVLLNGMDAPTGNQASSDPYPVTIRLTSLAFLPNRYTTNLRDCFILAAGTGRLDSERVMLRTERLSCVSEKGGVVDVMIEGYVTGEDGKVGLRGTVVERTGALLARAALSGLGSGLSEALTPQYRNSVQTGGEAGGVSFVAPETSDVLQVGAYAGAAKAMDNISNYYLERAEAIFPVIELDALRPVTVHLSRGTSLSLRKKAYRPELEKEAG